MPPQAVSSGPARALLLAAFTLSPLTSRPAAAWSVPVPAGVELRSIAVDRAGCPLVGGVWRRGGSTLVYAAKYRGDGTLVWKTEADPGQQISGEALKVAVDPTGDLFVTGTESLEAERTAPFAARFSGANGQLLWHTIVTAPGSVEPVSEGSGESLSLGAKGQLVLGGSLRAGDHALGVVCRLAAGDGSVQWCWAGENLVVRDTVVDRAGDVLATGTFFLGVKLDGADGAELWRAAAPSSPLQERGYPQMRSLALDKSGNVTVGGSLRETVDDTRAFYTGTLSSQTGRLLWENAGPALHSFEAPARLLACGSSVLAAGRREGDPAVLGLQARTGKLTWRRTPWAVDDLQDRSPGVADLATDGKCAYALGTDFPGQLLLSTFTSAGKPRWQRDLGPGQGVTLAVAPKKRLYVVARRPGIDGLDWRYEVIGVSSTNGQEL